MSDMSLYRILDALADDDVNFSNIGTLTSGAYDGGYNTGTSHKSVSTGTWTQMATFTLTEPGVYLIKAVAYFASNSSGVRRIDLSGTTASASGNYYWNSAKQNAASSNQTIVTLVTFQAVSSNETPKTLYINVNQNSGSSLNTYIRYAVICLRSEVGDTGSGTHTVGVTDFPDLTNKPQINGNTLVGNKTSAQLGIQDLSFTDDGNGNITIGA